MELISMIIDVAGIILGCMMAAVLLIGSVCGLWWLGEAVTLLVWNVIIVPLFQIAGLAILGFIVIAVITGFMERISKSADVASDNNSPAPAAA